MSDCVFCKMVQGEIKPTVLAETDRVLAFRDINPQAPTHVLVIPKQHLASLNDPSSQHADLIGELYQVAQRVAAQEGIAERGYRTVINCGPEGGQEVHHLHLHVLGGRQMRWPPG